MDVGRRRVWRPRCRRDQAFPEHRIHETEASKSGGVFIAADGRRIPNRGEQHVKMEVETGAMCGVTFNDAPVTDPIISVSRLNDSGHDVCYKKKGGYIEHLQSGQRIRMYRREGVYWIKVKIPDPSIDERAGQSMVSSPFHRRGR